MKTVILNPTYRTEDGYAFEAVKYDDFSKILRAVGEASSCKDVIATLNEKGIPFRMYKEETT